MNNIKILFCVFAFIISYQSNAQTVRYTYKALAAEGCNMKYSVAKQDTMYSIVATVRSDKGTGGGSLFRVDVPVLRRFIPFCHISFLRLLYHIACVCQLGAQ